MVPSLRITTTLVIGELADVLGALENEQLENAVL
jgi:hypothetical protein